MRELTERVQALETVELPAAASEARAPNRPPPPPSPCRPGSASPRCESVSTRRKRGVAELTGMIASAEEAKSAALSQSAVHEGVAAAAAQAGGGALSPPGAVLKLREERDQLQPHRGSRCCWRGSLGTRLREAAEDVAQLEVERAKTMAFDLEMARDAPRKWGCA